MSAYGYPANNNRYIESRAWEIADRHGRGYKAKDGEKFKTYIWGELCDEFEAQIESDSMVINNFTTQGISVSGDYALAATSNLANSVYKSTNILRKTLVPDPITKMLQNWC